MEKSKIFKRRLGKDPKTISELHDHKCSPLFDCPDVWELENGDFAVIGIKGGKELRQQLPESAHCGPDEEIVILPRIVLTHAKHDIPEE